MNPYKVFINLTLFVIVFLSAFGCKEEIEEPFSELDDELIFISDTSSFRATSFVKTFSQIAILENDDEWIWALSHTTENGQLLSTSQNNRFHGDFGLGLYQYYYDYNNEGIIIKANRERAFNIIDFNEYTFEFDIDGRIKRYQLQKTFSLKEATVFYNEQDQIIKIEFARYDNDSQSPYTYKYEVNYTKEGDLFRIIEDDSANKKVAEFGYENQNLSFIKRYSLRGGVEDDVYFDIYEYDAENRANKAYLSKYSLDLNDSENFTSYTYHENKVVAESIDYTGETLNKTEYGNKLQKISYLEYYYEYNEVSSFFRYAIRNTYEEFNIIKKEYFEGTSNNLELIGFSTLDIIGSTNSSRRIQQNYFLNDGTPLFYAVYDRDCCNVSGLNWFNMTNQEINRDEIEAEWPIRLLFENIY